MSWSKSAARRDGLPKPRRTASHSSRSWGARAQADGVGAHRRSVTHGPVVVWALTNTSLAEHCDSRPVPKAELALRTSCESRDHTLVGDCFQSGADVRSDLCRTDVRDDTSLLDGCRAAILVLSCAVMPLPT
jgi:hypothetical protein